MSRLLLILVLVAQPLLWWNGTGAAAAGPKPCSETAAAACDCCCDPTECECCVRPSEPVPQPDPPQAPSLRGGPDLMLPPARPIAVSARRASSGHAGVSRDEVPVQALIPALARLCIWRT